MNIIYCTYGTYNTYNIGKPRKKICHSLEKLLNLGIECLLTSKQ